LSRGVHHLALCTDDMKATVDFYVDVLGMPLVHAMKVPPGLGTGPGNRGNPPYEEVRHYFFDMGHDSLLAFFEIPKGKEPVGNRNAIGGMQHCAFTVTATRFARSKRGWRRAASTISGQSRNCRGSSASISTTRTASGSNSPANPRTANGRRSSIASRRPKPRRAPNWQHCRARCRIGSRNASRHCRIEPVR
jgi:catechol 2,3-dioxygenase-like lactoylglutathione lyase family enzyme